MRTEDQEGAISFMRRALGVDPSSQEGTNQLETMLTAARRWADLDRLLQHQLSLATTPEERAPILAKQVKICEQHLDDREALKATAEISYYVHADHRGTGIGTALIQHAMDQCPHLGIKTLFAILLDINQASVRILDKLGFEQWGHLPRVANFDGQECGHLYYGRRLTA